MSFLRLSILTSLLALASCGDGSPVNDACGGDFNPETGAVGDFGADDTARKMEAFLEATVNLNNASLAVEADMLAACKAMVDDLELDVDRMDTETEMQATCRTLAEEISTIRTEAMATLVVTYTPAVCEVSLSVAAECAAECDASITGEAEVTCEGGELYGTCEAECTGQCVVTAPVANCMAECEGTCTGSCEGTCQGTCTGACSAEGPNGECAGDCTGTCTGSCSAECMGSCTAGCHVESGGVDCEGTCRGECSVEFMEPHCDGHATVMAEADCKAACETEANAEATCTEPEVTVTAVVTSVDPADEARAIALATTLQENYGKFLAAAERTITTLVPATGTFVTSIGDLAGSVAALSTRAVACAGVAADAAVAANVRIEASVEVSASVQGSVSGSGGS